MRKPLRRSSSRAERLCLWLGSKMAPHLVTGWPSWTPRRSAELWPSSPQWRTCFWSSHAQKREVTKTISNVYYSNECCTVCTNHLSDHGEVRASMLINSQQIHHPDKPEDDVQTVCDASRCPVGISLPTHCQSGQEKQDGDEIWYIPVFWEPNLQLLAQFCWLRH